MEGAGRSRHAALDHAVCAKIFFGDGVSVQAKDRTGKDSLVTTLSWGCSFTNCQSAHSANSLEVK